MEKKQIANSILELIGKTPLVRLNKMTEGCSAQVIGKLECMNPCFSVKDRIGLSMIEAGEKDGTIQKGSVLIEVTSGNTGIALAWAAALKGYRIIIVMTDNNTIERQKIIKGFGAELVLTPAALRFKGAYDKVYQLLKEIPNSVFMKQFDNLSNPEAHQKTTSEEIWNDTNGEVDIIVAGVGTGGTLTGISEVLKKRKPRIKVVAVEPEESSLLSGGEPHPHKIYGIGLPFIPSVLKQELIDEIFKVPEKKAVETAQRLMKEEGIFAGISAGANVFAAIEIAKRPENEGKMVVTIICDTAERYLSSIMFENL